MKDTRGTQAKAIAKVIDYQRTFSTECGKRVLYDLMRTHHMMGSTFVKGDADEMSFREGERNVVLRILNRLKLDVKQLEHMMNEAQDEEN